MVTDLNKNHLSIARTRLGLTQLQVAAILGLRSAARVCEMESGRALPTARDCMAFQFLFKRSFEELWPRLHLEIEAATDNNIRKLIQQLERCHIRSERKRARTKTVARNLATIIDGLPEDIADII